MQYLNEDMDDLFRKAAEDYPLKADQGNWDIVAKKMAAIAPEEAPVVLPQKRKKRFIFWWLLLLLIPAIVLFYNGHHWLGEKGSEEMANAGVTKKQSSTTNSSVTVQPHLKNSVEAGATVVSGQGALQPKASGLKTDQIKDPLKGDATGQSGKGEQSSKPLSGNQVQHTNVAMGQDKVNKAAIKPTCPTVKAPLISNASLNKSAPISKSLSINNKIIAKKKHNLIYQPSVTHSSHTAGEIGSDELGNPIVSSEQTKMVREKDISLVHVNETDEKKKSFSSDSSHYLIADVNDKVQSSVSSDQHEEKQAVKKVTPLVQTSAKDKQSKIVQREKGLFLGVVGGLDASSVKTKPLQYGYNLGVSVRYQFSRLFSIESGVIWTHKKYSSEGEYFKKEHTNLPAYANLEDVYGYCNMFDIPINLQLNFFCHNKSSLFTSAGLSSYFMVKENYTAEAVNWGRTYYYALDSSYRRPQAQLFCMFNWSVGYEYRLRRNRKIYIEPYLKLPLRGLGMGQLPIYSTGINVGIIQSFH